MVRDREILRAQKRASFHRRKKREPERFRRVWKEYSKQRRERTKSEYKCGERFTEDELKVAFDPALSAFQAAMLLGRSESGVKRVRYRRRRALSKCKRGV